MIIKELPEQLKDYVNLGSERVDLEYKRSIDWEDRNAKIKITKAMMAMSNIRDGGVIIIGVEEDGTPSGMTKKHCRSFEYDKIARHLNARTMPPIDFVVTCGKITHEDNEKLFVVIQISESKELPVVSIKHEKRDPNGLLDMKNTYIRENAIYIRSKSPIESREIGSYSEWKEFIELLLDRNQDKLVKKIPWSSSQQQVTKKTDKERFARQRDI